MAHDALVRRAGILVVHMALRTHHRSMGARQRERSCIVIERRRCPSRCRMAVLAGLRKTRGCVIGRRRGGILGGMAGDASFASAGELTVGVALNTGDSTMSSGQNKRGGRVIERRRCPCRCGVAIFAGLREA